MDSAAGSPASSSDLYSSSDPENPPSYLLSRNGFKSRAEVPSGMQHEPVDSNGSEVAGPIPVDGIISLQRSSLENPLSGPNGQNKRKREQDTDYPRPDSNRSSPNGPETLQDGPTCEVASGNDTSKPSPSGRKLFRGENPIGKRAKLDEHATGNGRVIETKEELQSGRSKVDSLPLLPPEILQHIFSFVPPVFLGRLLRVSRTFHKYLTSDISDQTGTEGERSGPLERMKADAIWASSRKRFCPSLPKPLRGLKELDMWRLLRGQDCQLCREKKMSISPLDSPNPWLAGPGENSVRVIWPFGVRCCGKCLEQSSEK
ncbi:hypothetical protein MMC20_001551, partial [Loxospora ochrophaea]|nr:hypothetical protein [Loxospora ochrophaea]